MSKNSTAVSAKPFFKHFVRNMHLPIQFIHPVLTPQPALEDSLPTSLTADLPCVAIVSWLVGHFVAPFVAHAFCNHMGFPDVAEVFGYKQPRLTLLLLAFLFGLLSWASLLEPMTRPQIYSNELYYQSL